MTCAWVIVRHFFSLMFLPSASRTFGEAAAGFGFFKAWVQIKFFQPGPLYLLSQLPPSSFSDSNESVKSHFTPILLVLQRSSLQTDGCISSSLKISPLPFTFSCQTQTAHLPFPDSYLPTLLQLLPANLPSTAQPLGKSMTARNEWWATSLHYLTWTSQKGCLVCWGVFDDQFWLSYGRLFLQDPQ